MPYRATCGARLLALATPGDRNVIMGARDDPLSGFAGEFLRALAEAPFFSPLGPTLRVYEVKRAAAELLTRARVPRRLPHHGEPFSDRVCTYASRVSSGGRVTVLCTDARTQA